MGEGREARHAGASLSRDPGHPTVASPHLTPQAGAESCQPPPSWLSRSVTRRPRLLPNRLWGPGHSGPPQWSQGCCSPPPGSQKHLKVPEASAIPWPSGVAESVS